MLAGKAKQNKKQQKNKNKNKKMKRKSEIGHPKVAFKLQKRKWMDIGCSNTLINNSVKKKIIK